MASIEERLARREFEHKPGAELFGEIIGIAEGHWPFGPYPILVVRDDKGVEHIVSCYLDKSWLAEDVIAARPKRGERIGIRCDEPEIATNGKSYNRGAVEFDRDDDVEPDWDRMIQSREESRRDRDDKPANNGGTVDTSAPDPWATTTAKATEQWKAATSDDQPPY
jgi:hypothetical protein